jgi:hypothetical protein
MKHVAQHEIVGITKAEFDALIWVRDELASGRIESQNFDMDDWGSSVKDVYDCGSARCIGGWMSYKLDYKIDDEKDTTLFRSSKFHPLFFPFKREKWFFTPAQAVRAIDNFLFNSPGDPQWVEAVKA